MVSTLDGKATIDWRTQGLSDEIDRALFHHLRTQADAVMAGAGTVRAERYGRVVKSDELREKRAREGLDPDGLLGLVSGTLHLPADLPVLADPSSRVVIVTAAHSSIEGVAADVSYIRQPRDGSLAGALATLRSDYGVRSILCEGGPHLNSELFRESLVDELFLCL